MKPTSFCLLLLLLSVAVHQSTSNYYGKRGDRLDNFQEYLTKRLATEEKGQDMEAHEVLKKISQLVQKYVK